jgi:ubiquinol-cytochrome c reductase cytochrome b/c1 subunit
MVLPAVLRDPARHPRQARRRRRHGSAIVVLAFLPWLDTSKVKSMSYRPIARQLFWAFVIVCIGLGYLGAMPAEGGYVTASQIFTVLYFGFFGALFLVGLFERPKALPSSIADSVLGSLKAGSGASLADCHRRRTERQGLTIR